VPSANISDRGDAIVSSRTCAGSVKLGLTALGVVAGLAAMGGVSLAQGPEGAAAAAAASPPAASDSAAGSASLDKGRMLFTDYGCANCHTLGDAGATGHVGPSLDGNPNVTEDFVTDRVTNGQGMMPSFASQLTPDEIKTLAAYVAKVAMK
jgi:mono/diheme cytochrome c family protein